MVKGLTLLLAMAWRHKAALTPAEMKVFLCHPQCICLSGLLKLKEGVINKFNSWVGGYVLEKYTIPAMHSLKEIAFKNGYLNQIRGS